MHAKVDELFQVVNALKQRHPEEDIRKYADHVALEKDIHEVDTNCAPLKSSTALSLFCVGDTSHLASFCSIGSWRTVHSCRCSNYSFVACHCGRSVHGYRDQKQEGPISWALAEWLIGRGYALCSLFRLHIYLPG
jgi:hypothetical protein